MIRSQALANRSSCVRLQGQVGQALVEFTIAAMTLLVPLFFMISYVAKYHDMQAADNLRSV
jgi:Flp pilus assembly protein TadG